MTPALKAMVEAMAAERDRQIVHDDVEMADELDLEKVARAALAAAIDQVPGYFEAEGPVRYLSDEQYGYNKGRALLDAILGEKP